MNHINIKMSVVFFSVLIFFSSVFILYHILRVKEIRMPALFRPEPGVRLLMSMEGFRFSRSENGRIAWRMQAGFADLYENREAQLKDIKIIVNQPGRGEAVLLGDSGTMDTQSGNAVVKGGEQEVRVVTSDGYLLTTNSIEWNARLRKVKTSEPFKLLGREIYLEGRGITADIDSGTLEVKDNVKAVLQE